MGQKVHPYGFRVGTLYGWQSNWFAEKHYAEQLHEDVKIRAFIKKKLYHAGISKVVIERTGEKIVINIHTARPGILIGKRGAEVDVLRKELKAYTARDVFINIKEIRKAELDAQLVAENIADAARATRGLPARDEEGDDRDDEVWCRGDSDSVFRSTPVVRRWGAESGTAMAECRFTRFALKSNTDLPRRERPTASSV